MRQPVVLRIVSVVALGTFVIMLALGGLVSGGALAWLGPLAAVIAAIVMVRNWRLRVVVTTKELVIVNVFRTHSFTWSEVDRVVYDGGVNVRLRSGREVGVSTFADVPGALPLVRRRNAQAAKRLQAAVKHYRRH
jgi:hypothetical protein